MTPETIKSTLAHKPVELNDVEWLYPSKLPISWGSTIHKKAAWIDPSKLYKTRNGDIVSNIILKLKNSIGNEITYPIHATITDKNNPRKKKNHIYTLVGERFLNAENEDDLILVKT
jgi:hypothetical protein